MSPYRQSASLRLAPCVIEAIEHLLVQQLIAQAAIERLSERSLLGLALIDRGPIHTAVVRPSQDRGACERGTMLAGMS